MMVSMTMAIQQFLKFSLYPPGYLRAVDGHEEVDAFIDLWRSLDDEDPGEIHEEDETQERSLTTMRIPGRSLKMMRI